MPKVHTADILPNTETLPLEIERPRRMKLKYQLPRVYEKLLPGDLLQFSPEEKKATCDTCAMAKPRHRGKVHYREDLKCCTFHPFLPNYLVGALLLEPANPGTAVLQDKIARREYALPIGMVAPIRYQLEFGERKENDFGQREEWLCPYYNSENQNCNVWRNRGVVCTTFHCKSSYGPAGLRFWDQFSDYLSYVEMALLEESLVMLDFSPRQIIDLLDYLNRSEGTSAEKTSWVLPKEKAKLLWNGYFDDQETFYKKTFAIVSGLDKRSFHELLGEQGEKLLEQVFRSQKKLEEMKL